MDARCTGDVCSVLERQTVEESVKCTLKQTVEDDVDGCEYSRVFAIGFVLTIK